MIKRREFITLLGGAAAWPLAARAQQDGRMRRVGVLEGVDDDNPMAQPRRTTFRQALERLGWVEGRNVRLDYRYGAGALQRYQTYAKELRRPHPARREAFRPSGAGASEI
jgi:putative ABC transport system substrate-binding protein